MKLILILLGILLAHGPVLVHALPVPPGDIPLDAPREHNSSPPKMPQSPSHGTAPSPAWHLRPVLLGVDGTPPIFGPAPEPDTRIFLDPQGIALKLTGYLPHKIRYFFMGFPPFHRWLHKPGVE
ncbi:MAG: hypothetical protein MI747_18335 [Desulfobacterales bacterium]|nr:hypothetical protein [Desulfobacterales bacterium]